MTKPGKPIQTAQDLAEALDTLRSSATTCPTCKQPRDQRTVPLDGSATVECADVFHRVVGA
jgi:hypothetical protein